MFTGGKDVEDARSRISRLKSKEEKKGGKLSNKDLKSLERARGITRRHVIGLALKGIGTAGALGALSMVAALSPIPENEEIKAKEGEKLFKTFILDERGLVIDQELYEILGKEWVAVIKEAYDKYHQDYDLKGQVAVVKMDSGREEYKPELNEITLAPEVTLPGIIHLNPDFFFKYNDPNILRDVVRHSITHAQKPKKEEYSPEKPFIFHNGNVELLGFHGLFILVTNLETGEIQRFTYFEEGACEALGRNLNSSYRASSPPYYNMGALTMHAIDGMGLKTGTVEREILKMVQSNDLWSFVKLMTNNKKPNYDDLEWLMDLYTAAHDMKKPIGELIEELKAYRAQH